jgi:uncharacterized BrkB/YihY/UPF0761 family membrane protein
LTFNAYAEESPVETPSIEHPKMLLDMLPILAFLGILMAFLIALIAALLFPAENQSKIWIKILGTEWGAISNGRIWTFISVLIVVALLWAFLIWVPSN